MARQVTTNELEKEYRRYKADMGGANNPHVVDRDLFAQQRGIEIAKKTMSKPASSFGASDGVLLDIPGEGFRPPSAPGMMPAHSPQQSTPATLPQTKKPPATAPAAPAAAPQSQSNVRSWGEPGQPGSGTARFSGTLPAPGSNFRNFGYDPAEAQQVQASPNYRQIGANTYMTNRGLMIQGDEGVADYFSRFQHAPSTPIWTPAPQRQAAQPQMPEAPQGGWKTRRAVYQAQMDAYNKALDRQRAMDIAQMQDARAAERFGFDQEQARQAMELQRAQLGLQADQNVWNRAKALSDMEQAAVGRQLQQIQLGAQQDYLRAVQSGDAAAIARAEAALQALNPKGRGGRAAKDAGGMKVHEIDFGDGRKLSGVINQDGSFSPVMPVEINWLYQNWNNLTAEQQRTAENMNPLQLYSFASSLYAKAQAARAADEEAKKKK